MPNSKLEGILDFYLVKKAPSLPKGMKGFLVLVFPYAEIIEIVFWTGVFLTASGGFELFAQWSVKNLPEYLYYGPFGRFMFTYQVSSGIATCELFTSHLDCSFNNFMSNSNSLIPREYTDFILRLVSIVLTLVVVMKLFALPRLFERRRPGWNLVFFASLLISVLFLVSLNIVGFLLFTLLSFYFLSQLREYYK
jgi:hypothetical protein